MGCHGNQHLADDLEQPPLEGTEKFDAKITFLLTNY
jgi:hypothetical protein